MFDDFNARALTFDVKNVFALAKAADLVYGERIDIGLTIFDDWGFKAYYFFDALGTQSFIMARDDLIVLAFRGTEIDSLEDIATDLRIRKIGGPLGGRVHRGFLMGLLAVWDDYSVGGKRHRGIEHRLKDIRSDLTPGSSPALWVTGHSLGAGLATLATSFLLEAGKPVQGLVTFGSPRVGDSEFATAFDSKIRGRCYRIVNNNDVVTRVPPRSFGYDHVGGFWYISEKGALSENPNNWYLFLDRSLGVICDIGSVGVDGIKDHAMNNDPDGYIPALRGNLSEV